MKPFAYLDDEFRQYLYQLIDTDRLEHESGEQSLGITKDLLKTGFQSLSSKQIRVFYKYVIEKLVIDKCYNCKKDIPWSEMFEALDNGNYCGSCAEELGVGSEIENQQ